MIKIIYQEEKYHLIGLYILFQWQVSQNFINNFDKCNSHYQWYNLIHLSSRLKEISYLKPLNLISK